MTTENLLPPDTPIDISILLPTRGRPKPLEQCLRTLLDRAKDPSRIEVMLAFDNDDAENIAYFVDVIQPYLDDLGVECTAEVDFGRLDNLGFDHQVVAGLQARLAHGAKCRRTLRRSADPRPPRSATHQPPSRCR